jgi:exodeoxyribonuclease-3
LNAHAAELYATGAPVVLAGDYNVVPTEFDIYPTKSWDRNALLQPESRAAYTASTTNKSAQIDVIFRSAE